MQTLSKIGGAASIVQKHVDAVMAQFGTNRDRDIAAAMLRYLVTPSRTKIAQVTVDLISYAEAPSEEVRNVLASLSDLPEARILRRLANPERYEVFHDVLAQPILDWRREYILQKERAAEDERRAAATRARAGAAVGACRAAPRRGTITLGYAPAVDAGGGSSRPTLSHSYRDLRFPPAEASARVRGTGGRSTEAGGAGAR